VPSRQSSSPGGGRLASQPSVPEIYAFFVDARRLPACPRPSMPVRENVFFLPPLMPQSEVSCRFYINEDGINVWGGRVGVVVGGSEPSHTALTEMKAMTVAPEIAHLTCSSMACHTTRRRAARHGVRGSTWRQHARCGRRRNASSVVAAPYVISTLPNTRHFRVLVARDAQGRRPCVQFVHPPAHRQCVARLLTPSHWG